MSRIITLLLPLFLLFSAGITGNLMAQDTPLAADVAESLWPRIEMQLEQPNADTTFHFILQLVRNHCGAADDCLFETYYAIMLKLERRFNLSAAIFVGEEMVKVAQRQGNLKHEAKVHRDLNRYHDAFENERLSVVYLEKALQLFERLGEQSAIISTKTVLLERSLKYRDINRKWRRYSNRLAILDDFTSAFILF